MPDQNGEHGSVSSDHLKKSGTLQGGIYPSSSQARNTGTNNRDSHLVSQIRIRRSVEAE